MKKIFLIFIICLILCGCANKKDKNNTTIINEEKNPSKTIDNEIDTGDNSSSDIDESVKVDDSKSTIMPKSE